MSWPRQPQRANWIVAKLVVYFEKYKKMQHFLRIIKIIVSFMFMISDDPIIVSIMEQKCELLQEYAIEDSWIWFSGGVCAPLCVVGRLYGLW